MRRRQVAGARRGVDDVTTIGAVGVVLPSHTSTIAAAVAVVAALVFLVDANPWWTMDHPDTPTNFRRYPARHLRHRHHRHRQQFISGFEPFPLAHSRIVDSPPAYTRRRFRHVDDKDASSGPDATVYHVVSETQLLDRELTLLSTEMDLGVYFRFCDNRLVSTAVDPLRCRDFPGDKDIRRRCSAELAQLDDEAEVKFRQFSEVMALFDCGHAYSLASRCDHCTVSVLFRSKFEQTPSRLH